METGRLRNLMLRFCLIAGIGVSLFACSDRHPQLQAIDQGSSILAFGDSLTYGTGGRGTSYPSVLQQLTGRTVINAGIPGEISANGLKRLPALLDRHMPSILILCHGGNDILRRMNRDNMKSNLQAMVHLAKDRGIDVVFIGVPDFSIFLDSTAEHDAVAEEMDLPYLADTLPDILARGALKADQIHPNAEGYEVMAKDVYELLQRAGAITL